MRRPLLLPLVPLYAAGLALREMRLERGWEKVRRLRWPVISVGNLSAGGAGKTPLVIALARLLTAGGFHVDVLSRGYGRTSRQAARVRVDGTAEEFGDEPLLIAREAGVPVYVAAERFEAGHLAEAESGAHQANASSGAKAQAPFGDFSARLKSCPDTSGSAQESCPVTEPLDTALNLHILDDGFQHRQLARDVDVLLVNREDWHDQMLPAGNLREGLAAVRRASVLVIPAEDASFESELRAWGWRGPVWRVRRRMEVPQVEGRVVAFCGIARPEQFFAGLETAGIQIAAKKKFADHHRYSINDLKELVAMARAAGATALITTEKDRMRIGSLAAGIADSLPMLTVSLTTVIGDEDHACEWLTRTLASSPSCARL